MTDILRIYNNSILLTTTTAHLNTSSDTLQSKPVFLFTKCHFKTYHFKTQNRKIKRK